MLLRYEDRLWTEVGAVSIRKKAGKARKDRTEKSAFPAGTEIVISLSVSRRLGDGGAVLRLVPDALSSDKPAEDLPMSYEKTEGDRDFYTVSLCLPKGLYDWEILFLRGADTLFTNSVNQVDFTLSRRSAKRFRLLIYEAERKAPTWFYGQTMYQIFPDRFFRGSRPVPLRPGAVREPDFSGGTPPFAEHPGDRLENNVFFGGTLYGVAEKLDYLASLGVGTLYLNPVFDAPSNHRYDTGDYETVDAMLGGEKALAALLEACQARGIRVILDGVFNHTGSDSRYFNKKGRYPDLGAYQSKASPYYGWYRFRHFPDDYECWWNIDILPRLNHENEACRRYFTDAEGIGARYIRKGIAGWRLDVADELSDRFLDEFRDSVKAASEGEALLIGEVWENAADKIAYGKRRRYFQDGQLDSVMYFPLRSAILSFCTTGQAEPLYHTLTELYASYPEPVCHALMNLLGTHDTERVLTALGDGLDPATADRAETLTNAEKAVTRLSPDVRAEALKRLRLAATIQFTVYGVPSIYYGDEAGMEGYGDPFCRRGFPWGGAEESLTDFYRTLGALRRQESVLQTGRFSARLWNPQVLLFYRYAESAPGTRKDGTPQDVRYAPGTLLIAANGGREACPLPLDGLYESLFTGEMCENEVQLPPFSALVLKKRESKTRRTRKARSPANE